MVPKIVTAPSKHFYQNNLTAHIYENVLEEKEYNKLKNNIELLFKTNKNLTYKTHRTNFNFNNKNHKIVSHSQNAREQQVPFDLSFELEYWHQTKETIKNWSRKYFLNNLNPIFFKYLNFFEKQKPFADEPDSWIPIRWHSNILAYSNLLTLHVDMNSALFKTENSYVARAYSLTFYMFDHEEGKGGEFWSENGFVYKPKQNSALCVNGNGIMHGVTENNNPDSEKINPRLAFTTRWAHIDDLYLPGHPDKCLYKLDF